MAIETSNDSAFGKLAEVAAGVIGGAFVTLITLRTKLAMLDRDIKDLRSARKTDDVRMTRMENREKVMLRLLIDISQKVGANQRFPDDMIALLLNVDGQES